MIDRTPNHKAGEKVTGHVIIPDACGVYDVFNHDTGDRGCLIVFEAQGRRLQIGFDSGNLDMMVASLVEIQKTIAAKEKPDTKELN